MTYCRAIKQALREELKKRNPRLAVNDIRGQVVVSPAVDEPLTRNGEIVSGIAIDVEPSTLAFSITWRCGDPEEPEWHGTSVEAADPGALTDVQNLLRQSQVNFDASAL